MPRAARALYWIGGLVALQALLALLVIYVPIIQQLDSRVIAALAPDEDSFARTVAAWITRFGSGSVVLPFMGITSLAFFYKKKNLWVAAQWGGFLTARLFTDGLKRLVARPRPAMEELGRIPIGWDTLSFPSGHTTTAVFFYGFLAMLCLGSALPVLQKRLVLAIAVLLVVMVGCSRMLLGVHFPSDVVGGMVSGGIGLATAAAINTCFNDPGTVS